MNPCNLKISLAQFSTDCKVHLFWNLSLTHAVEYLSNLTLVNAFTGSPLTFSLTTSPVSSSILSTTS